MMAAIFMIMVGHPPALRPRRRRAGPDRTNGRCCPPRNHAIVLVSKGAPAHPAGPLALRPRAPARNTLTAVTVNVDDDADTRAHPG